jgi:hypothetical protein
MVAPNDETGVGVGSQADRKCFAMAAAEEDGAAVVINIVAIVAGGRCERP